jgi:hypothetical protein
MYTPNLWQGINASFDTWRRVLPYRILPAKRGLVWSGYDKFWRRASHLKRPDGHCHEAMPELKLAVEESRYQL